MLTALKMLSSACKCEFYRPEPNAKGRPFLNWILKVLKCKKWHISTDGAQWVDDKNGVICLVIMFIARVMPIK